MPNEDQEWAEFERSEKRKLASVQRIKDAGAFLGLDWLFDTHYARTFDGVVPAAQNAPYLIPQEVPDGDEAEVIEKLVALFAADTTEELDMNAAFAEDGSLKKAFVDPHWGHTTGNLCGTLDIDEAKLGILHPDLRAGLFKSGGNYEVFCRPNYLYDADLPIAINRMSLKLKMPVTVPNAYDEDGANELDLLLSEGLAPTDPQEPDGQGFFFRDARQLLMASKMATSLLEVAKVLFDEQDAQTLTRWKSEIFNTATDKLRRGEQTHLTWDQKYYFSAGPYALGPGAMKFALKPETQTYGERISIWQQPYRKHYDAFQNLAQADGEIRFSLMIQVATPEAIPNPQDGDPPKCVMAAEYTDLAWNTDVAPFQEVGTLTLRPHKTDVTDPSTAWYAMPFSAWNTFDENRPLGQLFRARKQVHMNHRHARLTHSFGHEKPFPSPGKCPFRH